METYDVIYILGNLFMAYVIYKFMHIFYSVSKVAPLIEKIAYIGYFLCITVTHVFLKVPTIIMVANLILFFLLAFLYEGSFKKKVIAVFSIYFPLLLVETTFALLTSYLRPDPLQPFSYESEFGLIAIRIASLVLVLIIQGFKNIKNAVPIPNVYWASLLAVPLGTLIMLYSIFMCENISRTLIIVCLVCALGINLLTFYLYDRLSALLEEQMNSRLERIQVHFYEHQLDMMKTTLDEMRIIRHDLKNRLSPLLVIAKENCSDEMLRQLSELTALYAEGHEYSKSGNVAIDSIINYKLHHAESENISVSAQIVIPKDLALPTFDVAVILGNLIDNAKEAALTANERWIQLKLRYSKGCLLIEISNSFDGKLTKKDGHFLSRKDDAANHGLGLRSVQDTLQKYDGDIQIHYDTVEFTAKALLYI